MAKGVPAQRGLDKAKTKEAVAQAHDLIAEHYLDLTQALIDKAVGLRFQDEKGNVYTKEPDTTALIRAIEILGGKPVARVETAEAGGFSEFEEWIKGQAAGVQSVPAPEVVVTAQPPALPPPSGWKQTPRMKDAVEQFFWGEEGPPRFDPVPPFPPPPEPPPAGGSGVGRSVPPPAGVAGATGVEGARPPGETMDDIFQDIGLAL